MAVNTKAIGATIISTGKENINGMMAETTSEDGKTVCSTVEVYTHGMTAGNMKVSTRKIKNMDKVCIHGQRAKNTMVAGLKTNSMEKPLLLILKDSQKEAFGNTVKDKTGSNEFPIGKLKISFLSQFLIL